MSLKDKASRIDFGALLAPVSPEADLKPPKTAPGAMMALANDQRSELLRQNEALREQAARSVDLEARLGEAVEDLRAWEGAKPTRLIDTTAIAHSEFANRHAVSFQGVEFEQLKREILEAGGNVQPIKVRPVSGRGEGIEFEVVFGHRRCEACRQLGLPVLAMVDSLDDRSLFIEMERENRERADLSPWEQGVMYSKALERGLFTSNRQLASALSVDLSNLGKSLALARLPAAVIAAFASPLDIQLRWAPLLSKALESDEAAVLSRAREMEVGRGNRGPKGVLAYLLDPAPDSKTPNGVNLSYAVDGKKAATLNVDLNGHAVVRINFPLSVVQQRELGDLVERFVAKLQ